MAEELLAVLQGGPHRVEGFLNAGGHGHHLGVDATDELLAVAQRAVAASSVPFRRSATCRSAHRPLDGALRHLRRGTHTADETLDFRAVNEGIEALRRLRELPTSCGIGSCRISARACVTLWATSCIVVGTVGIRGSCRHPPVSGCRAGSPAAR